MRSLGLHSADFFGDARRSLIVIHQDFAFASTPNGLLSKEELERERDVLPLASLECHANPLFVGRCSLPLNTTPIWTLFLSPENLFTSMIVGKRTLLWMEQLPHQLTWVGSQLPTAEGHPLRSRSHRYRCQSSQWTSRVIAAAPRRGTAVWEWILY